MKKNVYILYMGDAWLSRSSLSVMGVFSSRYEAINAVIANAQCSAEELEEIKEELYKHSQTQSNDNNWIIAECVLGQFGEV